VVERVADDHFASRCIPGWWAENGDVLLDDVVVVWDVGPTPVSWTG